MRLVCSLCKQYQGEKDPISDTRVSHGVCPPCYKWFMQQQEISSIDDYLNTIEAPVIIVNDTGRVVALNKGAESALGKTSRNAQGLLGGEAMECIYARLPEGCGQTIHCPACTIRNLVELTLENRKGCTQTVHLTTEDKSVSMKATTEYIAGLVSIQFLSVLP